MRKGREREGERRRGRVGRLQNEKKEIYVIASEEGKHVLSRNCRRMATALLFSAENRECFHSFCLSPFLFRTPTGRSRLIQMHWLPSNGEREGEIAILLGVRAGWFLFWRREKERERERERRIEGTCISESGRRSWSLYRTEERESISSSSSASVSSSADDER